MKAAYKREKGRKLELAFAKLLRKVDPKAKRMPLSGADWAFKGDIYSTLPYHFECKNQERLSIWKWWEETEADSSMSKTPVLVYTSNHRPIMVTLKADEFIHLLKELCTTE